MFSRISGIFEKQEQDDLPFSVKARQVNRIIGFVALGLPIALLLTVWLTSAPFMTSISHFYFTRIGGDILVSGLSIIGVILIFLYRYTGKAEDGGPAHSLVNTLAAKFAGICALGVAFFPTTDWGVQYPASTTAPSAQIATTSEPEFEAIGRFFLTDITATYPNGKCSTDSAESLVKPGICGSISNDFWLTFAKWQTPKDVPELLYKLHFYSAGGMFFILCYFSIYVFTRPQTNAAKTATGLNAAKWWRNLIYYCMGGLILLALVGLFVKSRILEHGFLGGSELALWVKVNWNAYRLTFWLESLGLFAFGLSWMVKGRFIKALNDPAPDHLLP